MLVELIFLAVLFTVFYWYLSKPKNLPPGPTGVPLLGYLPWLAYYSKDRYTLIANLEKYGKIVSIRLGFNYMIFLNDVEVVKEAHTSHADSFSGRGLKIIQSEITNSKGIISSEGKYQRENRRFILRSLRNMGFGKISFEDHILESIDVMREAIDKHISEHPTESFDFRRCLINAVADNITKIIFGTQFSKEELTGMVERLTSIQNVPQIFFIANAFPFVTSLLKFKVFKDFIGLPKFKELRIPLQDMIYKYIVEHKSSFDRNNISDFIYDYIDEQASHQNSEEEIFWWDDDQIKHSCADLIGAGMGTVDTTVSWFLFLMANNQEWLEKVKNEIDMVIGRQRKPSTRDLPNLPLCEASILETLRWSTITGIGIPYSTSQRTELCGYVIPKGATVFSNFYSISRNKNVWPDPYNFNPAVNFLGPNQEIINKDKFLPFGLGRRSCIGESLAKMEVILFFISIFQNYTVSLDPKVGMSPMTNGIFRIPGHRILKFETRM